MEISRLSPVPLWDSCALCGVLVKSESFRTLLKCAQWIQWTLCSSECSSDSVHRALSSYWPPLFGEHFDTGLDVQFYGLQTLKFRAIKMLYSSTGQPSTIARDLCTFECLLVVCRSRTSDSEADRSDLEDTRTTEDTRIVQISKIVRTIWKIFSRKFGGSRRLPIYAYLCPSLHVHKALHRRRFIRSDEMTPLVNRRTVVYLVGLSI